MNIHKIKSFVLIALVATVTVFTSCKKQLEEYNPGGLTAESVFTTPAGFESLVNAAYSYNRWWYGKEFGYNLAEMGTDLWMSGAGDVYPELTQYTIALQSNQAAITTIWQQFYSAINLCNAGINNIGGAGLTPERQKIRDAELRFLRAFYYWHIVETWGGVHFSLDETTGAVTTANKTPVDSFYIQIFKDLDVAVAGLPTTTTDWGRVTKPAAEAFLARMYLTRGRNEEAKALALKVINSYSYKMLAKYSDLWLMSNATNGAANTEVIWAVNYSANLLYNDRIDNTLYPTGHPRGGHNGHLLFNMIYDKEAGMVRDIANGRPFNRYMPTRFLLDLFDETKDARYDGTFKQVWLANSTTRPAGMNIGDTAVYATKKTGITTTKPYKIYDRNAVYNANGTAKDRFHYVSLKKFDDPTRPDIPQEQSARDAFVIRLPEMYLIAAEASLKLQSPEDAATYINEVRKRAALPGQTAAMQVTAADITLDFILDERAREFAGEQMRWFDLKRTGKLVSRVQLYNPEAGPNIKDYHQVRPIPLTQLDAITNKDQFKQNPNYQ